MINRAQYKSQYTNLHNLTELKGCSVRIHACNMHSSVLIWLHTPWLHQQDLLRSTACSMPKAFSCLPPLLPTLMVLQSEPPLLSW
jgi:hypothetical protein